MLGDALGEERGQITTMRVLPSEGGARMEISIQANGTICGLSHTHVGTYETMMRPDGLLFGQGQGVIMTTSGDAATWTGQGIGHLNEDGSTDFRGCIYFETASPRLSRLNGIATLYEYSTDASGKTESTLFEWK
jgi:hypothetical protein